jgi:hypothetical protein
LLAVRDSLEYVRAGRVSACDQTITIGRRGSMSIKNSRCSGRSPRILVLALIIVGVAVVGTAVAAGPNGAYDWAGMKKCGSFKSKQSKPYRIYVYANKHLSCKKATRIMRAYWGPSSGTISHNGGSGAFGWVTLKKYPGWKCYSGAGGGSCRHRKAVAGYQN